MFKDLKHRLQPYFTKVVLKPVGLVFGSQLLQQIMSLGIGILIVRELPKSDYAIYTVLMSVQAILMILSTSGIMIGFIKIGGEIWNNRDKMASLINTAGLLRSYISAGAFLIASSYGYYLLVQQDIVSTRILFFLLCILLIIIPEIYKAFITEGMLLRKEIATVQLTEIIAQATRLLLLCIIFIFFKGYLTINFVLIITVIAVWVAYYYLIRMSGDIVNKTAVISLEYKKTLLHYIKLIWHNELFFAFRGQISIFIIGIYGDTTSLADFGALGRFVIIFSVLTALVSNILAPRFARTSNKKALVKQYYQLLSILGALSFVLVLFAYLLPEVFLWILGEKYSSLETELNLIMIVGAINLFIAGISYLNQTKGWIKFRTYWEIPLNIAVILIGINVFDIYNLLGVLYLSILIALSNLILVLANSIRGFKLYEQQFN